MKVRAITSPQNPIVRRFRRVAAGEEDGLVFAEGTRLVAEGLAAGLEVAVGAVSPRLRDAELRRRLEEASGDFFECSDRVFERLSGVKTDQGIAALFRLEESTDGLLGSSGAALVVVGAGIRDPGNLGALVRTAEAAGASGLITLRGGADPFRDKAVRGSMGSIFRLPVARAWLPEHVLSFGRRHALHLVVADGHGETRYEQVDYRQPTLLVLGGETAATPHELVVDADRVRIDMAPAVDSLNVAVAAGVILFEARRQRR